MAIPWLAALQHVPWSQVIEHAPKVLAKAQEMLRRRGASAAGEPDTSGPGRSDLAESGLEPTHLRQRIAGLEAQLAVQRQQIDQQTQMLGELAEQSASLVAAVDVLRRRCRWLQLWLFGVSIALLLIVLTRSS